MATGVINDDAKEPFRRFEVLAGPVRRRRWSAAEKEWIVAESRRAHGERGGVAVAGLSAAGEGLSAGGAHRSTDTAVGGIARGHARLRAGRDWRYGNDRTV